MVKNGKLKPVRSIHAVKESTRGSSEDQTANGGGAPVHSKEPPSRSATRSRSTTTTDPVAKPSKHTTSPRPKPPKTSRNSAPSLSEVSPGAKFVNSKPTIEISTPVPRTGPEPATEIEKLLNIKWSRYIPHAPTIKQIAACMLTNLQEVLFGGALGGGKSDWLAYEALRFCDLPGFCSIIFRRQLTDLKQPGSLIPRIAQWLAPHVDAGFCKYSGDEHKWIFQTKYPHTDIPGPPAMLQFGYIGEAAVRERYQSAEYQLVCFDELGQWPDDVDYLFMRSRLRKVVCHVHGKNSEGDPNYVPGCRFCDTLSAMPTRIRAATNPGPAWIKRRFGIIPDPAQFSNRHQALIAISEGIKVRWVGTYPGSRPFIPSYLEDNPHLNEKEYRQQLKEMSEEERSRLEDGNWEARKNSRFKRRWQRFYNLVDISLETDKYDNSTYVASAGGYQYVDFDSKGQVVVSDTIPLSSLLNKFTTTDPAVTVRQGPVDEQVKQKNSSAVVSTWGITPQQELLWLDGRKFKREIPDLVDTIVRVNDIWQPRMNKIECNGVGIGVAQYVEAAGLPVTKNYRKSDKLENSMCAQMLMRSGRVYFPMNTPWVEEFEDDVFGWTGLPAEDDDVVDTLSDAATEITPGLARIISTPKMRVCIPRAVASVKNGMGQVPYYGF